MGTFLFDDIIFGPVNSRRLGISLGVNLLPNDRKYCNFDCIYCECGWTKENGKDIQLPSASDVRYFLEKKLKELINENAPIDMITFAGNGEPTMHPEFDVIIEHTIELRDRFYADAKVAVLSNATMISNVRVKNALKKVDYNILKLDSAKQETIDHINQPIKKVHVKSLLEELKKFDNLIIQTLFLKGSFNGNNVDNTTETEIDTWLEALKKLDPKLVMIYTIQRDTPSEHLYPARLSELHLIAEKVKKIGLDVSVSG